MEQEQINIEDIMQEIRAEIRAKGYEDNEIPFSDIACLVGGTEVPFDLKDYLDDISMMDESRTVLAYRDISSTRKGVGKLITFVKKVIRKMVCFYVEPLVDDQNRFNELTTRVVAQTVRRYNDDDARIEELEKKIYKCERRIRELELRAIRSQMNPHFIFNALSSIQNLINRSANQEANKYLIDFSRLLRKVLATSEKKLVPLSDEIEQLQLYLKLEQLRFPFSYSLTVDNNIEPDAIEIPGMLIQPFVENAVKHGIAPRGTGEIIIRLSLQDQLLVIDIIDDGPGMVTETESGFGIRAISNEFEILKDLYNTEIGITIENRQKKESVSGCHVRLSIPL